MSQDSTVGLNGTQSSFEGTFETAHDQSQMSLHLEKPNGTETPATLGAQTQDKSVNNVETLKLAGTSSETEDGGPKYKVYKRRWLGVLSVSLLNIMASWGWLSFSALTDNMQEFFGIATPGPINWLSTVILFSYIVISPLVWWTLKRYNIKVALIIGACFQVAGNWIRYGGMKSKNFGVVMLGQILIGFGQPFALSSPTHYTDRWFTSSSRVSANAIMSLSNPLGGAIAQLVGPAIVTETPKLTTFVLITAGIASGCSLTALIVPANRPLPPCPSSEIVKMELTESLKLLLTNPVFLCVFAMFSVYVGFFNAFSTYIYQIIGPYGYSSNEAGIAGAILIVCGIVFAAVMSPIVDRTHRFMLVIRIQVPFIAACYIGTIFMATESQQLVGPYLVCALLGAISFSLLPVFLEWNQEQTSPVDPGVSSSLLWIGGQFWGAIFIIVMNALRYPPDQGNPPENMKRALIFEAVITCVGAIPAWVIRPRTNSRVEMDINRV